jgi:hypothetical protein
MIDCDRFSAVVIVVLIAFGPRPSEPGACACCQGDLDLDLCRYDQNRSPGRLARVGVPLDEET